MKKTQTKAFANLVGSIVFGTLGLWALVQTYSFQEAGGATTYVQPAVFPRIMSIGLLIFSAALLIQSVWKLLRMKPEDDMAQPAESINFIKDKGVLAGLAVIALCILFVVGFEPLGYVLTAALVSAAIMLLIGKRNALQIILVSVLVPLVMWLLFYKLLAVNIPMGVLQFLRDLVDKI